MITKIFATKLNKSFSMSGLISFSGETKTDNKLALISLSSQLKFNLKKDIRNVLNLVQCAIMNFMLAYSAQK